MAGTQIFTFEEQPNFVPLAATGAVKYEVLGNYDDLNGTPAPALSTNRFFLIDPSSVAVPVTPQGPELNDFFVNNPLTFGALYFIDFQIHEIGGLTRLVLSATDTIPVANKVPQMKLLTFRGWEQVVPLEDGQGTTSQFLDWDQNPIEEVDQRTPLSEFMFSLTATVSINGVNLAAGNSLFAQRVCSRTRLSFIVTCEYQSGGVTRLP